MDDIKKLIPGCRVEMLVHPNSDTILSMKVDNRELLNFDDSMQKLSSQKKDFSY
ncbi:MAG: hypothetical protein ACI4II_06640 [Acutalibacteraceae bacterium]